MSKSPITLFLVLAMQFLSLQGWAQNKPSKWLDICNDVKIINLKTRAYETFSFLLSYFLLAQQH